MYVIVTVGARYELIDLPASSQNFFSLLHAVEGEGCVDGVVGTSSNLSGSLEGVSGVVLWDFGWYFESAGIMPP